MGTRQKAKYYYVCIRKEDDLVIISTNKVNLSKFLGVSFRTVCRWIENYSKIDNKKAIIYKNIQIDGGKQRFIK